MNKKVETIYQYVHCNIANVFTLLRLVCTGFVLYVVKMLIRKDYETKYFILFLGLCFVIWASDYLDGKIARKLKTVSKFGAYFDVVVDFTFVFSMHILLASYNVLPAWFLLIILEKIINYIVTSWIQTSNGIETFQFVKDQVGLIVSASFFVTPVAVCMIHKFCIHGDWKTNCLLLIITFFAAISSINRVRYVIKSRGVQLSAKEENET